MSKFKDRKCSNVNCDTIYTPRGPASKYCYRCSEANRKESDRRRAQAYRIRKGLVEKPGVGKGGANKQYREDSQYKSGISRFQKMRSKIKDERRYCERCNKDLINASRYHWCVHHRNHNRSINDDYNLELLCKRCHQLEHDCHKAFEGATTIETTS